jgi:lysophospholipase L1-like esterase
MVAPSPGSRLILAVGLALLAVLVAGAGPAGAAGVRIMPLGDSITDGAQVPGGYRIELWRRLVGQDRRRIDFVGSLQNGPPELGDRDHEGHSGWRIDEVAASVDGWLARHRPEVVLLMIGTNDMLQNHAAAPARLGELLDRITRQLPAATVLVATLPPLAGAEANRRVAAFNRALPAVVQARAAAGRRVRLVDVAAGLTLTDVGDGVHPNESGHAKIAAAWYGALVPLLRAPGGGG